MCSALRGQRIVKNPGTSNGWKSSPLGLKKQGKRAVINKQWLENLVKNATTSVFLRIRMWNPRKKELIDSY